MHEQDFINILVELADAQDEQNVFWRAGRVPHCLTEEERVVAARISDRHNRALSRAVQVGRSYRVTRVPPEVVRV